MNQKKNQKQSKKQVQSALIIGAILCIIGGMLAGMASLMLIRNRTDFNDKIQTYKAGKTISSRDYDVRIDSVTRGNGEKGSLNPGEGRTYLIVTLYVKNKTSKVLPLYPVSQTYIKDSQGQTYSIGPAMVKQPFLAGDLAPGDQIKGEIAYEIPSNITKPLFYFEGLSSSPIIIQL